MPKDDTERIPIYSKPIQFMMQDSQSVSIWHHEKKVSIQPTCVQFFLKINSFFHTECILVNA